MANAGSAGLRGYAAEWLSIAPRILVTVFLVELVFNRVLFRVLVFIPPGRFQDLFGDFVTVTGVTAMNLLTLASAVTLAALVVAGARLRYVPAIILAYTVLDYLGVAELYWTLPLLAAYVVALRPSRVAEAAALALLAAASWRTSTFAAWLANAAWLLAPIALLARARRVEWSRVKKALPWAAAALLMTAGNPYIAGQVFIFALNLISPWLLPPAIILYSAAGSSAATGLLLNGPGVQLSSQVLALAALYGVELSRPRGGGGA